MNISNHFELISIFSGLLWLVICVMVMAWYRSGKEGSEWKLFFPSFLAKIAGGLAFSFIYIFYYQGGDTLAYWDGATILNRLFWSDFGAFVTEMFSSVDEYASFENYNNESGYPPGWIYREAESFFVCKVYAILSFFTLKSYWAMTVISSTILSMAFWSLYLNLLKTGISFSKNFGYFFLFIPTPIFWCAGVSKDTVVLICVLGLIVQAIKFIYFKKRGFLLLLMSLLYIYLIFKIRPFIFAGIASGAFIALTARFNKERIKSQIQRISLKTIFYLLSISIFLILLQTYSQNINQVYDEVLVIQQDFASNQTYGDKRYTIGPQIVSFTGFIQAFPLSVIAAVYRPYIWEALSPLLLLNGIEGLILIFLTWKLFAEGFKEKLKTIRSNEVIMFSLIFILVLGFSIGFTSGLFGVLARLKSVILPFVLMVLLVRPSTQSEIKKDVGKH